MKNSLIVFLALVLTSCGSTIDRLKNVGKSPSLSQLEVPAEEDEYLDENNKPAKSNERRTNSLWQPGSTTFFKDNRAWKVGDILKVVVVIEDSARVNSSTVQSRNGSDKSGFSSLFGKSDAIVKNMFPAKDQNSATVPELLSTSGTHKYNGSGNIFRTEKIRTEIAAMVNQILPNGNLVIQGNQEVRINDELREVKVAGIIRSKDISADNSIRSEQIAEARISYGGRGIISNTQQPRIGSQIVDAIAPF